MERLYDSEATRKHFFKHVLLCVIANILTGLKKIEGRKQQ